MKTTTTVRKRRLDTNASKPSSTAEMQKLAVEFFVANNRKNEEARVAEKNRKQLYGKMKEAKLNSFDIDTNIDGKPITLSVEIGSGTQEKMDTLKLYDLFKKGRITEEQFLSVISASKTAVEGKIGKDIAAQIAISTNTTENVSVSPRK